MKKHFHKDCTAGCAISKASEETAHRDGSDAVV